MPAVLALAILAPVLLTAALPLSAGSCSTTAGSDVQGNLVSTQPAADAAACCTLCSAEPKCLGACYYASVCYLKDSAGLWSNPGRIAVIPNNGSTPPPVPTPPPPAPTPPPDLYECGKACTKRRNCGKKSDPCGFCVNDRCGSTCGGRCEMHAHCTDSDCPLCDTAKAECVSELPTPPPAPTPPPGACTVCAGQPGDVCCRGGQKCPDYSECCNCGTDSCACPAVTPPAPDGCKICEGGDASCCRSGEKCLDYSDCCECGYVSCACPSLPPQPPPSAQCRRCTEPPCCNPYSRPPYGDVCPLGDMCCDCGSASCQCDAELPPIPAIDRHIKVTNDCPFRIRVQATGASAYSLTCKTTADCVEYSDGLVCDTTVNGGTCFFGVPKPSDNGGSYDLATHSSLHLPMPLHTTDFIDDKDVFQSQIWGGIIFASTGCDERENCKTGICFGNPISGFGAPGVCNGSQGPAGAVTKAEFTIRVDNTDFYDVSILDGVNIPAMVKPASSIDPADAAAFNLEENYWCGSPGSPHPSNATLSACSWGFDPTAIGGFGDLSKYLRWVDRSEESFNASAGRPPNPCNTDGDCGAGEVCGLMVQLSQEQGRPTPLAWGGQCGKQIGWFNADSLCKWTSGWTAGIPGADGMDGFQAPYCCRNKAGSVAKPGATCHDGSGVDTNQHLYECSGAYADSGYRNAGSAHTCGCADWAKEGIKAPPTQPCMPGTTSATSAWHLGAFPFAQFLERACPTAYSYPYDDYSSVFQCKGGGKCNPPACTRSWNDASYEITFCPDGKTAF